MSQNTTAMQHGAGGETTGATDMTTQQTDALQCAADLEYSIPMDDVMCYLPGALNELEAAWVAAWDTANKTKDAK